MQAALFVQGYRGDVVVQWRFFIRLHQERSDAPCLKYQGRWKSNNKKQVSRISNKGFKWTSRRATFAVTWISQHAKQKSHSLHVASVINLKEADWDRSSAWPSHPPGGQIAGGDSPQFSSSAWFPQSLMPLQCMGWGRHTVRLPQGK